MPSSESFPDPSVEVTPFAPAGPPRGALGRSVVSGARWMAGSQIAVQITRLGTSLVLARLLAPDDFGLIGLIAVVTSFFERVLGDAGTASALIQRNHLPAKLPSTVFFFNLGVGLLTGAFLFLAAPVLAQLLGDARTADLLRVVAVVPLLSSFGLVQRALLRRGMQFGRYALVEYTHAVAQGVSSIAFALLGWGVWALVAGMLVASATTASLAWVLSPWRPQRHFSLTELREISGFSGNLSAAQFFNYMTAFGDRLIIGRLVGTVALGYYSLAYRLLLYPVQTVGGVFRNVLFPAFSRLQDDDERMGRSYVRACAMVAAVTFPAMTGLALLSRHLIEVLVGPKWLPAAPVVSILAAVGALQSLANTSASLLKAKGRTDILLWWTIVGGVTMVAAYLAGVPWGTVGVAWGFLGGQAVLFYPAFAIPFRLIGLPFRALLAALWPIVLATGVMAGVVSAVRLAVEGAGASSAVVLVAAVPAGVVVYAAGMFLTRPAVLSDLLRVIKSPGAGPDRLSPEPVPAGSAGA